MTDKLNKTILAIAVPAIVSNITTPLLGLADTAIAGHIGEPVYLGAIAVGSTIFNTLYWLFGFLRMGTAGLTARAFGADNRLEMSATLRRGLLIAIAFGLLLVALSPVVGPLAVRYIDPGADTGRLALQYFSIVIFSAPASLATFVMNGWLLGMQDTRTPMVVALTTNVLNIALSATLVFAVGLKIEGVAYGTLTAQWVGVILCAVLTLRRYRPQAVKLHEILRTDKLAQVFRINADIFLRTLCLVAVTTWFTRAGASQGVDVLGANALLMQMFMFFSYFTDGFAFAGEALAGRFSGAGDASGLMAAVKRLMRWGLWIGLGFTAVYFLCGELILRLLTDDDGVVVCAREYLPWAVSIPLCSAATFIYDGIFVGLTRTRSMLWSLVAAMLAFFAIYFALYHTLGNHALWLAFVIYLIVRAVVLHLAMRRAVRRGDATNGRP